MSGVEYKLLLQVMTEARRSRPPNKARVAADQLVAPAAPSLWRSQLNIDTLAARGNGDLAREDSDEYRG